MKYALYARKSTEGKERQALSIQEQISECSRYTAANGLDVVQIFQEAKTSFKPHRRIEFATMLEQLTSGKVDAILTWKPDRLCRNPEEGGKLLQMLQDGQIKEIRTATGDVYTQESDHLVLQIHFGMANQFSRNLSQNTKRGLDYKVLRGEYPRPAPIGFNSEGAEGLKNLVENKSEGLIIKDLFLKAASGQHSLESLKRWTIAVGLRSKRFKRELSKSQVHFILTNPVYYGLFRWKGELIQGTYKPLIGQSLFDKVQTILHDRGKPKHITNGFWLNGLIKCGQCGASVTTSIKRKTYPRTDRIAIYYYNHCTKKKGPCSQQPVTYENLKQQILKNISRISIDKEAWGLGIELFKAKYASETKKQESLKENLRLQVDLISKKISRIIEMAGEGMLTKEEFFEHKNKLVNEKSRLKLLTFDGWDSEDSWLERACEFLNTAYHARNIMENGKDEEKIKLLKKVGWNLFLRDKNLEFSFNKPFDVLLKPLDCTKWGPRWDYIRTYYNQNQIVSQYL